MIIKADQRLVLLFFTSLQKMHPLTACTQALCSQCYLWYASPHPWIWVGFVTCFDQYGKKDILGLLSLELPSPGGFADLTLAILEPWDFRAGKPHLASLKKGKRAERGTASTSHQTCEWGHLIPSAPVRPSDAYSHMSDPTQDEQRTVLLSPAQMVDPQIYKQFKWSFEAIELCSLPSSAS